MSFVFVFPKISNIFKCLFQVGFFFVINDNNVDSIKTMNAFSIIIYSRNKIRFYAKLSLLHF